MSYWYQTEPQNLTPVQVLRVRQILERRVDDNVATIYENGNSNTHLVLGYNWDDFVSMVEDRVASGWRLDYVDSYMFNNQVLFNGIWKMGNQYSDAVFGWKRGDFDNIFTTKWNEGWRPMVVDTYMENGGENYNAIWLRDQPVAAENPLNYVYAWKRDDFFAENERMFNEGFKLREIDSFLSTDGRVRFNAVWQRHPGNVNFVLAWSIEDFFAENERLWNLGWKLRDVDAFVEDGQVLFNGVWDERGNQDSDFHLGWKWDDFVVLMDQKWQGGWKPRVIDSYVFSGEVFINAIWRK